MSSFAQSVVICLQSHATYGDFYREGELLSRSIWLGVRGADAPLIIVADLAGLTATKITFD